VPGIIDVSIDASEWIVREPAIPYTKMTPHIEELNIRLAPNRRNIACAATSPLGRNPANMLEAIV